MLKKKEVTIKLVVLMEDNENFLDYELAEVLKGNTDVDVINISVSSKRME